MSLTKSIACFIIACCLSWLIWRATGSLAWGGVALTLCLFVMTCVDGLCAALAPKD